MNDVERIARQLCEADGCDPDYLVMPTYPLQIGPFGRTVVAPTEVRAAWRLYEHYVQATLEAAGEPEIMPPVPEDAPPTWRDKYHLT